MSVTSVTEMYKKRGANWSYQERDAMLVATRHFSAVTDSASDTELTVLDSVLIPQYENAYPGWPWLRVVDRTCTRKSPMLFEVDVAYEQRFTGDPTAEAVDVTWDFEDREEFIDKDTSGNPLVNVNNELFEKTVTVSDLVVSIRRNESLFDAELVAEYKDAVNSSEWYGLSPRTARLRRVFARNVVEHSLTYFEVCYVFVIRFDTWDFKPRNEGYLIRNFDSEGEPLDTFTTATDSTGTPLNQPILLAADGSALAEGASPNYLSFRIYKEKNFNNLGFFG